MKQDLNLQSFAVILLSQVHEFQQRCSHSLGSSHFLQLIRQDPKVLPDKPRDLVPSVSLLSSLRLLPVGQTGNNSLKRGKGGFENRYPSNLNWLLLMQRSRGPTSICSEVPELLTFYITQRSKFIFAKKNFRNLSLTIITLRS